MVTQAVPFIAAAYVIGIATILGFWIWVVVHRRKLRMLQIALKID